MRIVLTSQQYPPETGHGGIGTQTHAKAHALAARGHDITVIAQSPTGCRYESLEAGVRVVRIPGYETRLPYLTDPASWITYSAEVAAAIGELQERGGIDIVDFPEWASEGYVYLLNRTDWGRSRAVVQVHGPLVMLAHTIGWPDLDSELFRVGLHMEETCLRLADAVYASSDLSAEWCGDRYGLDRERIETLHIGVDTRMFRPSRAPKASRPTIVFVGRIAASKGADVLVDAVCTLADVIPGLRLRMIGSGDPGFIEDLRARADAAAPDVLELPGPRRSDDLARELCQAHVLAVPSLYEGGPGMIVLEGMACGSAVVASAGSGLEEVIESGQTGVLVPPGDAESVAAAIHGLLEDANERERLGSAARAFILDRADTSDCALRLEALYQSLLTGVPAG